ncbi:hypothetical protein GH714_026340 [Hevea brasiliensis]|uniref:Cytochrome P450 n=1 Tax=Hevea brasiliensis TaxID=3981 RepID=A0A6A6K839_HEVBR|nr:hypothetical protein GH714_026340 [Hevea brasiliensis]
MDFSSNLIAILGAVALVIVCNLWRGKNSKKIKGKLVPEAPGGLPIIGHLHQLGGSKSLARTLGEMADKYGSVFSLRLGVHPTVIITDHKAMKDVFTTNDKLFAFRPYSSQAMIVGYNYSSFGFAPYGTYWRNMRKLATIELLSNHRTKILNYVQISEVSTLVKELYLHCKTNKNAKINMSERIEHLILNIITRMVAGKRYFDGNKEARDDAGRPIGEIIREFMFVTGALVPGDLIPFLGWLDINGVVKTMKRVTKEVDVIVDSWIEEHKKKSDNDAKKDFLDVMLSVVEDDASMGLDRETIIKGTTTAIILAGSDTTAITTLWALSSLVNNRHALKRAQEEIDQKVGRDRCVQVSDIDKLEYLTAVIKETLRLYPPGPLGVPREAAEDCFVSGISSTYRSAQEEDLVLAELGNAGPALGSCEVDSGI